jgi:ABC-type Fe3+/spermidine/putrescine transport system ATPase subunit
VINRESGLDFVVSREVLDTTVLSKKNVSISIRPEKILLYKEKDKAFSKLEKTNLKNGTIEVVTFLGVIVRSLVRVSNEHIIVDITEKDFEQHMLRMGDPVTLYFPPEDFLVFSTSEG